MSRGKRRRPKYLATKLRQIRDGLRVSQGELVKILGYRLNRGKISNFEAGRSEPDLLVLLAYANIAGITVNAIIDDSIELPKKLPAAKRKKNAGGKARQD